MTSTSTDKLAASFSPEYLHERQRAHQKWARRHGIMGGLTIAFSAGLLFPVYLPMLWKSYMHKKEAKRYGEMLEARNTSGSPA